MSSAVLFGLIVVWTDCWAELLIGGVTERTAFAARLNEAKAALELSEFEIKLKQAVAPLTIDFGAMSIFGLLMATSVRVRHEIEKTQLSGSDLSYTAILVLMVLEFRGEMEAYQLADRVGISKGTLTGVIKRLECKGLVTRRVHPLDRRRVILANTDTGSKTILHYIPAINAMEEDVVSALEPEESEQLIVLLRKLHRSALRVSGSNWD